MFYCFTKANSNCLNFEVPTLKQVDNAANCLNFEVPVGVETATRYQENLVYVNEN
jgi:hypothetical protein